MYVYKVLAVFSPHFILENKELKGGHIGEYTWLSGWEINGEELCECFVLLLFGFCSVLGLGYWFGLVMLVCLVVFCFAYMRMAVCVFAIAFEYR